MSIYEEVEIEDLTYNEQELTYYYPCPCGDLFRITLEELWDGEDIAKCPSCTLRIMIIFDEEDLPPLPPDDEDDDSDEDRQSAVDNEENDNNSEQLEHNVEQSQQQQQQQLSDQLQAINISA